MSHNLQLSTLLLNEGSSIAGPHHDMPCPLPALICGPGMCNYSDGEWGVPRGAGGRLFAADGLFDLSYGPTDAVLLDGNMMHGITGLRDRPGGGQRARSELERFSVIAFSTRSSVSAILKSDHPLSFEHLPDSHRNGSENTYFHRELAMRRPMNSLQRMTV